MTGKRTDMQWAMRVLIAATLTPLRELDRLEQGDRVAYSFDPRWTLDPRWHRPK